MDRPIRTLPGHPTGRTQSGAYRGSHRIAAAGFGVEEASQVLEREVAPAFHANLLSVAGEWSFWTPEEVRIVMTDHLRQNAPRRWLARVAVRWTRNSYAANWQVVATMLASSSGT